MGQRVSWGSWLGYNGCRGVCGARRGLWPGSLSGVRTACDHLDWRLVAARLKLQHFGHLMERADSLEKTLMREKMEGRRREG